MFNQKMVDVLTQVNGITNSVILKYPVTVAVSESQDMMVHVNIAKLDAEEFSDIGLKDSLNDVLSIIKLFGENSTIKQNGSTLELSNDGSEATYISDSLLLMDAYDKDPEQFAKTEEVPSVCKFTLSTDDIKNVKSATGVFKDLTEVIFTSQDGDVKISLGATNKFNAKSNTYSIRKTAETTKEFEIKIPVENFKKLPQTSYIVDVKYNATRNSYRILMTSETLEDFKLLLSVKI